MSSQGRSKGASHQRRMTPKDKARNTLARLHEAGKTGEQLLSIVITIKSAHSELGPWGAPDWQHVQIAKQAKKLHGVSGTRTGLYAQPIRYPRGEGLFMRHLGKMIEDRAADAIDQDTIEEIKRMVKRKTTPPTSQTPSNDLRGEVRQMEDFMRLIGAGGTTIVTH